MLAHESCWAARACTSLLALVLVQGQCVQRSDNHMAIVVGDVEVADALLSLQGLAKREEVGETTDSTDGGASTADGSDDSLSGDERALRWEARCNVQGGGGVFSGRVL